MGDLEGVDEIDDGPYYMHTRDMLSVKIILVPLSHNTITR